MYTPQLHNGELAQTAPDPIVTIDERSMILFANIAAEHAFGYPADEMVGQSLLMLIPERFRAAHEAGIAHYVASGEKRIAWRGLRVPVRTKSGAEIPVDISFGEFEWNGRRVFSGFLRDISEREAAEAALAAANSQLQEQATELEQQVEEAQALSQELSEANDDAEARAVEAALSEERARRLLSLSSALNTATSASQVADLILDAGMAAAGADAGSFALLRYQPDCAGEFEVVRTRGFGSDIAAEFTRFPLHPGRPLSDAVVTGVPILVRSVADALKRYPTVADVGYEGLAALPVHGTDGVVAAIVFSFNDPQTFDDATETFLRTVAEQCSQALERSRLYDSRNRASGRSRFLAEASRLLSSSLDYEATLSALAESAVPRLADWCAVDVVNDPTESNWPPKLTRLAVVHADAEKRALGLSLEARYPTDWSADAGLPAVLRNGDVQFFPRVTDEMLVAGTRNAEHLEVLRSLNFSSIIIAPLIARGLTLGAVTLVMSDSGRVYDQDDVSLANDLASRAAVAIDNARLFRDAQRARQVAEDAMGQAAAASSAKSSFLATMSHELRTPINAVLGYAELLALEIAGPLTEEQQGQVARIRASTAHLLTLVNEVLDLAKIESGTLRVAMTESPVGETANAALALVTPQATAKGVIISERCEGACDATYMGDPDRVRQVLANLIANAVKFTPQGGSVTLDCACMAAPPHLTSLAPGTTYVGFKIADDGIGIPADQQDKIFEAFVQADGNGGNPYTREQAGTGLGLAISRQLARQMDGDIFVESEVGVGSTFTLLIPAASSASSSSRAGRAMHGDD